MIFFQKFVLKKYLFTFFHSACLPVFEFIPLPPLLQIQRMLEMPAKRKTKEKKLFLPKKEAKIVFIIYCFFLLFLTGLANQVGLRMKMTWICRQSNLVSFSENILYVYQIFISYAYKLCNFKTVLLPHCPLQTLKILSFSQLSGFA